MQWENALAGLFYVLSYTIGNPTKVSFFCYHPAFKKKYTGVYNFPDYKF